MLRISMLALGVSLTMVAAVPSESAAQLNGRERSETTRRGGVVVPQTDRRDDRDRNGDWDRDRDRRCYEYSKKRDKKKSDRDWNDCNDDRRRSDDRRDRRDDDDRYRQGSGPKFCQSGQGHPVHGRAWCRQKGWENASMRNVGWGDVILRRPRTSQNDLGRSVLMDILGRTVYGRFDSQRSRLGLNSAMTGQWRDSSAGSVLNLYASGIQIAQVLDRNRDGRADVVYLNYGR